MEISFDHFFKFPLTEHIEYESMYVKIDGISLSEDLARINAIISSYKNNSKRPKLSVYKFMKVSKSLKQIGLLDSGGCLEWYNWYDLV